MSSPSSSPNSRFKPAAANLDFPEIEHRILAWWAEEGIFEERRRRNQGNPRFSFIDGPITANNPMGVHHAWGRTLKDLWQRYQAMLGRDQRYQNGFDCQGLWVEVEVEKALGLNSKRDIESYGLDKFSQACRERVARFSGVQTEQSKRLGQWMDWPNSYFTMTDTNISYIWTFLAECHRKGWLYRGHQSMPWCTRCGTSLSQHELIDSYNTISHPSVYVSLLLDTPHLPSPTRGDTPSLPLPARGRESIEQLLIWTTTPWTLPANVAVAVNPAAKYVRLKTDAGILYIAEARLQEVPIEGEVLSTVLGSELVGQKYRGLFDELPSQKASEHRVVAWDEVSLEEGTGLVHIAPGCGQEDFLLAGREKLTVIPAVDEMGRYLSGFGWLEGISTSEANPKVLKELEKRGRLVSSDTLSHRYPVCWRCGTELIYRVVDEWFISSKEIRQPMIEATQRVEWHPPQYGKRMIDWLRNMGDWCISRKRYWGLPLPFYFCPSGHLTLIESKDQLKAAAIEWKELPELHRPWIDEIQVRCQECGQPAERTKDVGDCWLDAGIVPFSTLGWHNPKYQEHGYAQGAGEGLTGADLPDHAYWERWFPADWVCEMREQIRLWFYSMLFMSVALTGETPYRRVLCYEKVHDEKGRAMHKSWGNAIWFDDAVEQMGAEVMRWSYAGQDPAQNLNFGFGPARDVKRKLLTLWNTYSFFVLYAGIDGYQPSLEVLENGPQRNRLTELDRWLLARTEKLIQSCCQALDTYDSPALVRSAESYLDDLSNWYVRLSRPRFWKAEDDLDKKIAYDTLWYSLCRLIRCLAPVLPFLTEELWSNLVAGAVEGGERSVHLTSYPEPAIELLDTQILSDMAAAREVVEAARSARVESGIKTRQPLSALIVASRDPKLAASVKRFQPLIQDELNVKSIRLTDSSENFARVEVFLRPEVLGPKYGREFPNLQRLAEQGEYSIDGPTVRLGGKVLTADEVEVRTRAQEGYAVADGRNFAVALDTEITPELELEGQAREVIRAVQDLRRKADLEMTDRIELCYPAELEAVFTSHGEWIRRETLALVCEVGEELKVARAQIPA